jgi:hypothetical protein
VLVLNRYTSYISNSSYIYDSGIIRPWYITDKRAMIKTDPSPAFDKKLKERIMFRAIRKCSKCGYTKDESVGFNYHGDGVWTCIQCGSKATYCVPETERDIQQELRTVELNLDMLAKSLQAFTRSLEVQAKELKSIRKGMTGGHN